MISMENDFISLCPIQKYYLISKLQFNATFVSYSTYLAVFFLMLRISSALFINNLHILEYYMLHFPTFRNTELIKMNVNYHSGRFRNTIII